MAHDFITAEIVYEFLFPTTTSVIEGFSLLLTFVSYIGFLVIFALWLTFSKLN